MLTIEEILKATSGQLIQGTSHSKITNISIDSRKIKKGDLFVAIKGNNHDGHSFLHEVEKKGVTAVLVSKKIKLNGCITIYVSDTTKALGDIAQFYRKKFSIPIIAITGSAGKTTSKELIAGVLSSAYKVLKNDRSENNHIGVPLTIFKLDSTYQVAVMEMGTNQPGDIEYLSRIVQPTVLVFTNIGDSHLEKLKNRMGVFKEKTISLKYLTDNGKIILNADDPFLRKINKKESNQEIISFSIEVKSQVQASQIKYLDNFQTQFYIKNKKFILNVPGRHNVYNALAAICCAQLFKIKTSKVQNFFKNFKAYYGRQAIEKVGKYWLCDDSYNSNPVSFKGALTVLDSFPYKGRRFLICADMLELGSKSKSLHAQIAKHINHSKVDFVITYGQNAQIISKLLSRNNNSIKAVHCSQKKDIHEQIKKLCLPGDFLLVKGSRSMHMEETVNFIKSHLN